MIEAIEKIHPEDGDIVLIRVKNHGHAFHLARPVDKWKESVGKPNILFLFAPFDAELELLTEAELKGIGLKRIDEVEAWTRRDIDVESIAQKMP